MATSLEENIDNFFLEKKAISPEQNVGNLSRTEHRIKNIAKGTTDPRVKLRAEKSDF